VVQFYFGVDTHERTTPDMPHMRGFTVWVIGGAIQRLEGELCAYWESMAPNTAIQRMLDRLDLLRVEARAQAESLSTDPSAPTIFHCTAAAVFPKGEVLPDARTGEEHVLLQDLHCRMGFRADATLVGSSLGGPFLLSITYQVLEAAVLKTVFEFSSRGQFSFTLK
jgi:hypothetical protein